MTAEFRLLGDFEARVDGRIIDVGHARQRCVLVVLLVEANRAVSVDRLIDRVWADHPPQRARGAVYNYVSRLRRALANSGGGMIARRSEGYCLTLDPLTVDLHRFRHLVGRARVAAAPDDAAALLGQALAMWRGDAF